ncbi:Phosphoenolpyruvate carboxylase [Zostera marina]|uniref:Phosphoenolpyruvate carboxylase n=1 Tax=Zostera marina TaxID=29655 RepID=A0A0K9NRF2_ZOSMR|nr:Phosphoenolpyruvate carboxylase [Zostera marina]
MLLLNNDNLFVIFLVLDFDFEKFCSVSLSNLNVYACLVCGKYYQGRGRNSHAYTHSLEAGHHVYINLRTERVYCLPDGYEINDPSLDDIRHVLNPSSFWLHNLPITHCQNPIFYNYSSIQDWKNSLFFNLLSTLINCSQEIYCPDWKNKSPQEIFDALKNQTVDLVFTAHPTQAIRRSLLQKHARIRNCLSQLTAKDITLDEKQELNEALQREVFFLFLMSTLYLINHALNYQLD